MSTSHTKWIKRLTSPLPSSRGAQRRGDPACLADLSAIARRATAEAEQRRQVPKCQAAGLDCFVGQGLLAMTPWGGSFTGWHHRRKGLTLVEAALVLGIVGLVAGAIWGTMTAVKKQQAISDTAQTILQIASTIKATYTGHASTASPPTTVATQIANGLYPPHVINAAGDNTLNAWGGTIFIQFPPALAVDGFALMLTFPVGMDPVDRRAACMALVSRYSGSATTYAGGFVSNVLPDATIPLAMTEEGMPALTFINRGGWTNVTGLNPTALFPAAGSNCTGFAVYFKL